jgi:hypothetical protein
MWAKIVNKNEQVDEPEDVPQNTKIESETETDYSDDYEEVERIRKNVRNITYKIDEDEMEFFGWDGGELTNYGQRAVKRFRLKKLKSIDGKTYYFDNVLYFIWRFVKDPITAEESLVKPDSVTENHLRQMNNIQILPFLAQPQAFW